MLQNNMTDSESPSTTRKEAREYFSKLDKTLVKKLYSAYKVDFELFGYEADDFFILPAS